MATSSSDHPLSLGRTILVSVVHTGVIFLATTFWAVPAQAQNCEAIPDTVVETFPASGSRSVPLNGLVRVFYCPSDQPLVDRRETRLLRVIGDAADDCVCEGGAECIDVGLSQRCVEEVGTSVTLDGDEVRMETTGELEAHTSYVVEAPEPSMPLRVSFQTGATVDNSSPEFTGLESVRIIGCGAGFAENAACPTELNDEGFIAILRAQAAADEAGAVNVAYRAFQVRGEQLIERGRVRGDGAADVTISIFIPSGELNDGEWERLCFNMSATDPYGQESMPDRARCEFTPEFSPFGSACTAAGAPVTGLKGNGLIVIGTLLGLALSAFSRRNRRL